MLPLHNWVREGNKEARLKFVRALGDPGTVTLPLQDEPQDSCATLADEMAHEVVRTLVSFSMGTERQSDNGTYYHYPYGKKAATSTKAFKQIPDAWFAVTLATMYPFVVCDRKIWSTMLDKFAHPLTGLWPWGVLYVFYFNV